MCTIMSSGLSLYVSAIIPDSLYQCLSLSLGLTASYQSSTSYCSLFAEHVSQGQNTTDIDWTTIILDTCAGRDSRIYPCLIDATQADRKLCDLFSEMQPIKLVPPHLITEPAGYTGGLTKSFMYWPMSINGEGGVLRASDDMTIINPLLFGYEWAMIDGKYSHLYIDQRSETALFYFISRSSIDLKLHQMRLTKGKVSEQDFLFHRLLRKSCQRCYFAIDSAHAIYISMDNSDTIDRHEINGEKITSIFVHSPAGMIVRNHDLWLVNNSHLIILSPRSLFDHSLTYLISNQIDLSLLPGILHRDPTVPSASYSSTFLPFHLDVDNYGRMYVTGALFNLWSGLDRQSPADDSQLYILIDVEEGIPSVSCAGSWGMFGVHVYHSKLKIRMLTSMNDFSFHFYSNS